MCSFVCFFFQAEDGIRDYKVTGVQTCALPISHVGPRHRCQLREPLPGHPGQRRAGRRATGAGARMSYSLPAPFDVKLMNVTDRKSTRLNSSHLVISYAVFCLKKKKNLNYCKYSLHFFFLTMIMPHVAISCPCSWISIRIILIFSNDSAACP